MEFLKHSKQLEKGRRISVGAIYNEDGTMTFGYAICKPGDVFRKKVGHDRAVGKARSRNPFYRAHVSAPDREMPGKFFINIANGIIDNKNEELKLRDQIELNTTK